MSRQNNRTYQISARADRALYWYIKENAKALDLSTSELIYWLLNVAKFTLDASSNQAFAESIAERLWSDQAVEFHKKVDKWLADLGSQSAPW